MSKKHGNDKRINKICLTCKKDFLVSPSRIKAKTCSRVCLFPMLGKLIARSYDGKRIGWKGKNGYIYIGIEGKQFLQHRIVIEKHLGRKLKKKEQVHHLNRDRTDNRIENLTVMLRSEHARLSAMDRWHPQIA